MEVTQIPFALGTKLFDFFACSNLGNEIDLADLLKILHLIKLRLPCELSLERRKLVSHAWKPIIHLLPNQI
jgi:hypothetical protein